MAFDLQLNGRTILGLLAALAFLYFAQFAASLIGYGVIAIVILAIGYVLFIVFSGTHMRITDLLAGR